MQHPEVKTALFEPSGRYIVSWSQDDMLLFWDQATGLRAGTAFGPWSRNANAIVTPDGSRVFSWDIARGGRLWNTVVHKDVPLSLGNNTFKGAIVMPDG